MHNSMPCILRIGDYEMICVNCIEILRILDENDITINCLDNPPIFIVGYDESEHKTCSICNKNFDTMDLYLKNLDDSDEIENLAIDIIADKLSKEIDFCGHCDGEIVESYYRAMRKEVDKKITNPFGIDVYDFLENRGIEPTSNIASILIEKLKCQNCGCGTDYDSGLFSLEDNIYFRADMDSFYGNIRKLGFQYGIEISEYELNEFFDNLKKSIMLASISNTGKKILELVAKVYDSKNIYKVEVGVKLFRGRKRAKKEKKYEIDQLWNPPSKVASQGRYNLIGSSMLYLCDHIEAIPYELNLCHGECIDIGEFEVKKKLDVFDIEDMFSEFGDYVYLSSESTDVVKEEYLFCNYIAQCCEYIGFDGIKYPSNKERQDYNYAIFDKKTTSSFKINNTWEINFKIKYLEER